MRAGELRRRLERSNALQGFPIPSPRKFKERFKERLGGDGAEKGFQLLTGNKHDD